MFHVASSSASGRLGKCASRLAWTALCAVGIAVPVRADGMLPETSVVIVNEVDGEASINVRNSDPKPSLLHVTLQDIPEDGEALLFVTPPVSRVEPGESQLVRFILRNREPLKTQRLKRAIFEGLHPKAKSAPGVATVGVNIRQNLPVIVHPKGLAPNREPWKGLTWTLSANVITVRNDTPYVVRLAQEVHLLPGMASARLPRAYVLPGSSHAMTVPATAAASASIRLYPATVYGFTVDSYDAPLGAAH